MNHMLPITISNSVRTMEDDAKYLRIDKCLLKYTFKEKINKESEK